MFYNKTVSTVQSVSIWCNIFSFPVFSLSLWMVLLVVISWEMKFFVLSLIIVIIFYSHSYVSVVTFHIRKFSCNKIYLFNVSSFDRELPYTVTRLKQYTSIVTLTVWYKACSVFSCPAGGIGLLNPSQRMVACPHFFSVYIVLLRTNKTCWMSTDKIPRLGK